MSEATLSRKNQIVIPLEARRALRLKAGDKLLVIVRGDTVIILPKPAVHHKAIRGLALRPFSNEYLEKERQSWERSGWAHFSAAIVESRWTSVSSSIN